MLTREELKEIATIVRKEADMVRMLACGPTQADSDRRHAESARLTRLAEQCDAEAKTR